MGGFYWRLLGMVKSLLRKDIGRTQTQFTTFPPESEGIINSQPLVYIEDDTNSTKAIAPMIFWVYILKSEDLYYDNPDYKSKKETSDKELLQI